MKLSRRSIELATQLILVVLGLLVGTVAGATCDTHPMIALFMFSVGVVVALGGTAVLMQEAESTRYTLHISHRNDSLTEETPSLRRATIEPPAYVPSPAFPSAGKSTPDTALGADASSGNQSKPGTLSSVG